MSCKLARETVKVPNEDLIRTEIAKNLNHLRINGMNWVNKTSIDFPKQICREAMNRMQVANPRYVEVKHESQVDAVRDNYIMLQ